MRTDIAQPIRLKDYLPARLADGDRRARRLARIRPRRRSAPHSRSSPIRQPRRGAARARRRRTDAHRAQARRRRAAAGELRRDARQPDHRAAAEPAVHARDRDAGRSDGQYPALRPLSIERHLLHAMRGGRLPPHHLFPRPARRDGGLHHAHRSRQNRSAGAAVERQSHRQRRPRRTAGISPSGTIRIPSPPICSRWSAAISAASRTASAPCRGATSRCASMSSPARRRAAATPWTRSSARCAGTRRRSAANTTSTSS